jgi:pimeloyl-ACP methyl ester carboxylesterase
LTGLQCATITVPRNPQDPSTGGTIQLALDRKPASGQKLGSLLVDPGGPGVSGVDFLPTAVSDIPSSVRSRFDLVGFDPPGVGRTAPIVCLDGKDLDAYFHADPAPPTAAGLAQSLAEDHAFVAGCEQNSRAELPYVSTVDAAMDMDVIRADVGDPKLTYIGFSYGTLLGATYARLFPGRVRAMVLDGAVDPSLSPIANIEAQSVAFESVMSDALKACDTQPSCPWKPGPDPVGAFQRLLDSTRSHPLPAKGTARTVGPSEFFYGSVNAAYFTPTWPELYQALAGAARSDGTKMLALSDQYLGRASDGSYNSEQEAIQAVTCIDAPAPTLADIEAAAPAAAAAAPIIGVADLYGEIDCSFWPVPATGRPAPVHADGSPPIVVVGTTGDPVTPYAEAQALASQLQHGVLLTRVGDGHTGYVFSSCIRNYADSYLVRLTVPPAGVHCATD